MINKVYGVFRLIRDKYSSLINIINFKFFRVNLLGKPGKIEGILTIRSSPKGAITIGKNVQFRSGKEFNIIGGDTRLILRVYRGGKIEIGDNVGISNSAIVSMNRVTIEDNVFIGGSCCIWDTDFHSLNINNRLLEYDTDVKSAPILIRRGAFIGARSIILKGVTIGENAIVGAGSVITKNIPSGEIWAGNPAKFIKKVGD